MAGWSDEGMWLFSNPPRQLLQEKYQFEVTNEWLTHLQQASVRLNSGGSGSFVSPDGLLLTNHHVGADSLHKLSPKDKDFYRDGFQARTQAEELKCPDSEVNVLVEIVDVTAQVKGAVTEGMKPGDAAAARRAVMTKLEKDSMEATKLRSDIVTLYNGAMYHLYRYQKFTDVRLVFAPEKDIASFGGDVDNFEFPRYNLDICFFRVYENGVPYKPKHWLKWNAQGPKEGELVFVSGHPGTTQRLETFARLLNRRDLVLPYTLARLRNREATLIQFSAKSPDYAKMAQGDFYSTANSRKAFSGQMQGLLTASIMKSKQEDEQKLAQQTDAKKYTDALKTIADTQEKLKGFYKEYSLLEFGDAFDSQLFRIARHLLRLEAEKLKPNADRLREYRDTALTSLEQQLYSPAPIYPELEIAKLGASLTFMAEQLGGGHPACALLKGKSPHELAAELVRGTRLVKVDERKRLASTSVVRSDDAMIQLAIDVDAVSRSLRKMYEEQVEEPERQAYADIVDHKFKVLGPNSAPDATFTLRLAFGSVRGYEVDGKKLAFHTTFGEVFQREAEQQRKDPFHLPESWHSSKAKLNLQTPFNFASTADTIGGNSGSPVVNRAGEFVGINFDRNRHGLVRNFIYTDVQARHIAVHSAAIVESLRKVYGAEGLLKELGQ